jgi:hypothetical protein
MGANLTAASLKMLVRRRPKASQRPEVLGILARLQALTARDIGGLASNQTAIFPFMSVMLGSTEANSPDRYPQARCGAGKSPVSHVLFDFSQSFRCLWIHCIAEPAHHLFGEDTNFDWPVVDDDVVPCGYAPSFRRELHSDTPAAMLNINNGFDKHRELLMFLWMLD